MVVLNIRCILLHIEKTKILFKFYLIKHVNAHVYLYSITMKNIFFYLLKTNELSMKNV